MDNRVFIRDLIPVWYRVRFAFPNILIDIHPRMMPLFEKRILKCIPSLTQDVQECGRRARPSSFVPFRAQGLWGFGAVIETTLPPDAVSKDGEFRFWYTLSCRLPRVRWMDGNDERTNWRALYDTALSLRIIFDALKQPCEEITFSEGFQLQLISLGMAGIDSWQMDIALSPNFIHWLEGCMSEIHGSVRYDLISAILHRQVWKEMWSDGDRDIYRDSDFSVMAVHPQGLHLSVPGDMAGLDPGVKETGNWGYHLCSHGLNSPLQQLTLLVGFALLSEMAQRSLNAEAK